MALLLQGGWGVEIVQEVSGPANAAVPKPGGGEALASMLGDKAFEISSRYSFRMPVFGETDARKLRSSLTLFEAASGRPILAAAIERWFGGTRDEKTLRLIAQTNTATGIE